MKLFHLLLKCWLLLDDDVPVEGRSRGLWRGEEVNKQTWVMKKRKRQHNPSCCGNPTGETGKFPSSLILCFFPPSLCSSTV